MGQINLQAALQLKKRMVGDLNTLKDLITKHNSHRADYGTEYDVEKLLVEQADLRKRLAELKSAVMEVNAKCGLYPLIVYRDELKDEIQWLSDIPTLHGARDKQVYGRGSLLLGEDAATDKTVEWVATIRRDRLDTMIKKSQTLLDRVQTEIDYLNHVKTVELAWLP